jgi:enamine deaminase RidA (YjgF/YER057c/UK114 family)
MSRKEVIGAPLVIDGRVLSLSQAVRAGDFVFVTGQVPMRDGEPMTDGSIEDQTRACLESLQQILAEAGWKTFRDLTRFIRSTFPTNRQHGLPW